jgi:hypothetical protein
MKTRALTHVAMSVPVGTLTTEVRAEILAFYGDVFGWREMEGISNDERLAMWIGPASYINVRERDDHAELSYEHFGVSVRTADDVHDLWSRASELGAHPEPLETSVGGVTMFKFQHLLPMAIEVQFLPEASP